MAHHGNRETLTYYEQVTIDGQVMADDCVPCLLVTPIMTRWMLCFEPVGEDALYLLRGIPREWLQSGKRLATHRLLSSAGEVSVTVSIEDAGVDVELTLPRPDAVGQVYLDLRLPGGRSIRRAKTGGDWIARIEHGYRLAVRPGAGGDLRASLELTGGDR
jgi:hypothetical protein